MEDRLVKLAGHADRLLDYYLGIREKYAILHPMIFNQKVVGEFGRGARARGYGLIRHVLFCDCAKDIINLCFDTQRNAPSLSTIVSHLQDREVRSALEKRYGGARLFDEVHGGILGSWDSFTRQKWVGPLRKLRDKVTAHLEVKKKDGQYVVVDVKALGLKWRDLDRALQLLDPVVLDINSVTRNSGFDMVGAMKLFERAAAAFWGLGQR